MNVLDEIIAHKKLEVEKRKSERTMSDLEKLPLYNSRSFSLKRFLVDANHNGIVAEFKRRSPSKGIINKDAHINRVTRDYASNGASGLSILTDEKFFGGSIDDLIAARINEIPILRKDFIIDEYQIVETKAIGADVILLIAGVLNPQQVKEFTLKAHELGLEVLLEIHTEAELEHIHERTDIVGVNNRDLKTFHVDIERSVHLGKLIPKDKLKISESGISSVADIRLLRQYGYKGFLIGEQFMQQKDPGIAFMRFAAELNEPEV
ncbi:MAG TPA: indole-3-glycerol phosphate synthase TrpC [Chitinophagaceae bacterium]